MAYSVDSLVCILADLSLNVCKHVSIPVDMGVLFCGGVFWFIFVVVVVVNRITL